MDEALQWHQMSGGGRRIVEDNMNRAGQTIKDTAQSNLESFQRRAQSGSSAASRQQTGRQARGLAPVVPELENHPVTLQRAANTRQKFYDNALEAQRAKGNSDNVIPAGAGWYFNHHADIRASAEEHGFDHRAAIAASGVMSPQNSPDNEKAAVGAIMQTLSKHKVTVTPRVVQHLSKKGIDVSEHVGKTVQFDQLPTGTVAHLSDTSIRDHVPTDAPLHAVSKGGTKQNIVKAEHVLWGDVKPEDAMDPKSAPKVWSYIHNTLAAEPNSPQHVEYMGRVHQDALVRAGQISPHQTAIDVGGTGNRELLNPKGHTVEDTWQNSATFDQPHKTVGTGRTSVFKAGGSLPDTYPVRNVGVTTGADGKKEYAHREGSKAADKSVLTHAFNNRATQKAAEQQGRGSGVTLPPVAMQEVGWTQMRREVGKDAEHKRVTAASKPEETGGEIPGQMALFGKHTPGVARVGGAPAPVEHHDESDVYKWAAIGNAHRNKRMAADHEARAAKYSTEFNQRYGS